MVETSSKYLAYVIIIKRVVDTFARAVMFNQMHASQHAQFTTNSRFVDIKQSGYVAHTKFLMSQGMNDFQPREIAEYSKGIDQGVQLVGLGHGMRGPKHPVAIYEVRFTMVHFEIVDMRCCHFTYLN
jgi:hypothetical protein